MKEHIMNSAFTHRIFDQQTRNCIEQSYTSKCNYAPFLTTNQPKSLFVHKLFTHAFGVYLKGNYAFSKRESLYKGPNTNIPLSVSNSTRFPHSNVGCPTSLCSTVTVADSTLDTYTHVTTQMQEDAARKIGGFMAGAQQ